ncbi:hypothetical protein GYMLUDRAFT_43773 [Collybiopsis luxurians FD-317 M1]|uniref:C2H2-type domain-containing protein n=1 Tax=Collybiopsis luxurians FD-317 M1 TaxID=944289 RepID=A0A0D0BXN2_9AGAR|nr:hypothetical protein GYMLUDRAFT_43773 [Collybiopsis luxurians FD-317 M1]
MSLTAVKRNSLKSTPNPHHHGPSVVEHDCPDYPECSSEPTTVTAQCTDQCVVITCDGPGHGGADCSGSTDCDFVCQNSEKCHDCDGFDELLQCCNDFHPYLAEPKTFTTTYNWGQDPSTDSCQVDIFSSADQGSSSYAFGTLSESSHSQANSPTMFGNTISEFSFDYSQTYQPSVSSISHHSATPPLTLSQNLIPPTSDFSPALSSISPSLSTSELQDSSIIPDATHTCMWGNCNAQFSSPEALVDHVNTDHLLLTSRTHELSNQFQNTCQSPTTTAHPHQSTCQSEDGHEHHKKFSCLWRDCHEFFPELVDAPSRDKPHAPYDQFTIHILSQHLGYPGPHLPPLPKFPDDYPKEYLDLYADSFPNTSDTAVDLPSDSSRSESACSRSATPQSQAAGEEKHACNWKECGQVFDSCDALTSHLNLTHVGGGKPHYDCYWGDCGRNGQNGFTSKQKICRHLQSHTGHRPFQCKLCHQNFSEAATLQQHMRRHTREKPYVCDYPGCGKSFAITGALTIHKRTHNGHKPFKCTYCDRAFAESSNLSKHLRTHTGDRPYLCSEPGCNKAFARPDQLNRHSNVHKKKAEKAAAL